MAYRNKTYVVFNADPERDQVGDIKGDMTHYRTMQMWKENNHIEFDFHDAHELNNLRDGSSEETIKRKLRERLSNAKLLVVLVGKYTRFQHKFVRWEIEIALKDGIPIVVSNINGKRKYYDERCPAILDNELAIHIPFKAKILQYAFDNWPASHEKRKAKDDKFPVYYLDSVYEKLGLNQTTAKSVSDLRDIYSRLYGSS